MFSKKAFITCIAVSFMAQLAIAQTQVSTTSTGDLAPLKYKEVPLGNIRPRGWLRNQLEIMRSGTTGHLDEVYAKIMNDNGWLGGQGDGWEETPYWLDGAVPLAYLVRRYKTQRESIEVYQLDAG